MSAMWCVEEGVALRRMWELFMNDFGAEIKENLHKCETKM